MSAFPVEVVVVAITWNVSPAMLGLSTDELEIIELTAESDYSPEVVARFLAALPKPPAPSAPLRSRVRVLDAAREIEGIVKRNPAAFGQGEPED